MSDIGLTSDNKMGCGRLNSSNYNAWAKRMQGRLMCIGGWGIIDGTWARPKLAGSVPTNDEKLKLKEYEAMRMKCAGEILLYIDEGQFIHVENKEDSPEDMWAAFKAVYQSQVASSRFLALQALSNIRMETGETLSNYITRVNRAGADLKLLVPPTLTVANFVDELTTFFAHKNADHIEYGYFARSLP